MIKTESKKGMLRLKWLVAAALTVLLGNSALAVVHVPTDTSVGDWDVDNRIFILTTDIVDDTIQIDEDDLTLDGNGHAVTYTEYRYGTIGVYLKGKTGVTVKNITVTRCYWGIKLYECSNNKVTGNTIGSTDPVDFIRFGIKLDYSSDNTITHNILSGNGNGISLALNSNYNTITDNTCDLNGCGIWLDSSDFNKVTGNTARSNSSVGIALHECDNNTLTNNSANSNYYGGIALQNSSNNILTDNTASNGSGIFLRDSSTNNTLTGNTASYNASGIALHSSSNNNTLTANTTSHNNTGFGICISNCNNNIEDNNASNNWHGILLSECSSNTLTGNVTSGNTKGIRITHNSDNNQIYNNNFIANTTQATVGVDSSGNIFNLDKPIGGNYWSDWTTPDDDSDGFVDFPYEFTGGQDDLPWADPDGWTCRDSREMIQELADQVLSLNLQHGISNSLDTKLDAALQALEDINENNDTAAINTLEAFINAVEAQSGNKIPQADADALIFKARKIIDCMRGA